MIAEPDVMKHLDQEIEEFHRLREISGGLQQRAQWPRVQSADEELSAADETAAPEAPAR